MSDMKKVGAGDKKPGDKKKGSSMGDAVKGTEAIRTWDEHKIGPQALAERLGTDVTRGLSDEGSKKKHGEIGDNALSKKASKPWYCLFLEELTGFFSLLLWFGSFLCFIGYGIQEDGGLDKSNLYLGVVLATVTLATGVFSYMQASKSAEMMAQFENFIPPVAYVVREGREQKVDAKYIVPGDIVKVKAGENIPCDVMVFKANEMKVNNASLTGESEDILIDPELPPVENIFETKNVAFFGTMCTAGEGVGICFKTGDATVIGQIANLASSAESAETPLSIEIHRFIKIISAVAIFLGVTFFFFGLAYGYGIITNLVFMIGIIVANVPEGLLATVTVSLALTAQRMAGKMVLVKNLESVETLGSTSCICSDKTGTLTQNRMTVSHMFINRQQIDCSVNLQQHERNQALPKPDEKIQLGYDPKDPAFVEMVRALVLGTYTIFNYDPSDDEAKQLYARVRRVAVVSLEGKDLPAQEAKEMKARLRAAEKKLLNIHRHCKGDASETGLVQFAQSVMDIDETRARYPTYQYTENNKEVECLIPFSSDIKFNLFVRDMKADSDGLTVYMKGAPERILTRCSKLLVDGREIDFTPELREEVATANSDFGKLGERVLAFAKYTLPRDKYSSSYKFDVKTWKTWGLNPKQSAADYESVEGSFPMHDLTLVGVVSLNDPPRPKVDLSVQKCRSAGIKVIMVTGDQPPTAAAIAHKVNILKHPKREFNYMVKDLGMDQRVAWEQATGIVVHGDLLAEKHLEQDHLDDDDPQKGQFLQDWISKPEVVFARTTPSQKLLIVDACQKAGHVVAVTGDGVNDSPAIKKADIGIAMGSGSDVAKNAADMLLLDDNFSSIVNGVEEGRLIFDNLKKSIAYTLSSNIPEISPFIFFIVFQVPLPLSTVLILCIDLGTDMVPAISFAYENPELDIMDRVPRNAKLDHLVNTKLISFAYFQIGVIQASAGMYTYFLVLNDFGVRPGTVWGLALQRGPLPATDDIYDGTLAGATATKTVGGVEVLARYGHSNYSNAMLDAEIAKEDGWSSEKFSEATTGLAWDYTNNGKLDIRLFYSYKNEANPKGSIREPEAWTACRWPLDGTGFPEFYKYSHVTDGWPICYSTEALKYAQSGYLVSIVAVQWADLMICKTRNLSLSQQLMINRMGNFGLFFETSLVAILLYVPFLNVALGTRQIPFAHFAVPSFSFYCAIFFYDELRKLWLRSGMVRE
jgi:sodium/potassium-transporting ATPase subunit alpha